MKLVKKILLSTGILVSIVTSISVPISVYYSKSNTNKNLENNITNSSKINNYINQDDNNFALSNSNNLLKQNYKKQEQVWVNKILKNIEEIKNLYFSKKIYSIQEVKNIYNKLPLEIKMQMNAFNDFINYSIINNKSSNSSSLTSFIWSWGMLNVYLTNANVQILNNAFNSASGALNSVAQTLDLTAQSVENEAVSGALEILRLGGAVGSFIFKSLSDIFNIENNNGNGVTIHLIFDFIPVGISLGYNIWW